jgi:hypothetical protein
MEAEQKERFEEGKKELATVLLDYGDTLTGLRDTQTVAIAAFLRRGDFFLEGDISTLVVKAKMSDLRAYANGSLSQSAMRDRITYQEYSTPTRSGPPGPRGVAERPDRGGPPALRRRPRIVLRPAVRAAIQRERSRWSKRESPDWTPIFWSGSPCSQGSYRG